MTEQEALRQQDQKIPFDTEAEAAVLGAIMLEGDGVLSLDLTPEDFYDPRHRATFAALLELAEKSQPLDLVAVHTYLASNGRLAKAGGASYLAELVDTGAVPGNARYYAETVRDLAVRRRVMKLSAELYRKAATLSSTATEELLSEAEDRIFRLGRGASVTSNYVPVPGLLLKVMGSIERLYNNPEKVAGLPTGLADLDRFTGGLLPSDLVLVAARPGMGKTALALTMANALCMSGRNVLLFSLEMSAEQICKRLIAMNGLVDGKKFRTGRLTMTDFSRIQDAMGRLEDLPMLVNDDADVTLAGIRSQAMRAKSEGKLDLVIVDYLQLLSQNAPQAVRHRGREQDVSEISRGLKKLAKKLDVPVVALSQLNRGCEMRTDKRPLLADLRESGSLEQDADLVIMIYREAVYDEDTEDPTKAELLIRKQRNGPCGRIYTRFIEPFALFRDYTAMPEDDAAGREAEEADLWA